MKIGALWNKLANPKNIPRLFAFVLGIILICGLFVPFALNVDNLYLRPGSQVQIDSGDHLAPYNRGGSPLTEPGLIFPQYPGNAESLGFITSYLTPVGQWLGQITPYFGTSICSSPGGILDEILYYTRGFDTILESSILMMSFVIASWVSINYTMNRKNEAKNIKKDFDKAIGDSTKIANEVRNNDIKSRNKQFRRDN